MLTAIIATLGAALYGVADFLGGMASRRAAALSVTVGGQLVGFVALLVVSLILPPESWTDPVLLWGVAAGLSGGTGVLCLYAGLAAGRMSVVAPITASLSAAIPAAVGIFRGERLSAVGAAGVALALVAVVVVSLTDEPEEGAGTNSRAALVFAVLSGIGFSGAILAFSQTPASASFVPLVISRLTAIIVLGSIALARGLRPLSEPNVRGMVIATGLTDAAANAVQVTALRIGPLAIASVLGALYPVVTVILARYILHERLRGWQRVGIVLALVAVVLTAWPA